MAASAAVPTAHHNPAILPPILPPSHSPYYTPAGLPAAKVEACSCKLFSGVSQAQRPSNNWHWPLHQCRVSFTGGALQNFATLNTSIASALPALESSGLGSILPTWCYGFQEESITEATMDSSTGISFAVVLHCILYCNFCKLPWAFAVARIRT